MEYKLVKKAWGIDLSLISEGYLYDTLTSLATTKGKAKSQLLKKAQEEDLELLSGQKLDFFTLPAKREPQYDRYLFEEKELTITQINEILSDRERLVQLKAMLDDPNISHCYIRKRGSYYCSGWAGYTDIPSEAGVYLKEEAIVHAKGVREITVVPINIEEHNSMIQTKIEKLKSKLIAHEEAN